jgi:transposase-like protein
MADEEMPVEPEGESSEGIKFCPLCGSQYIKVLKSQNFRCQSCNNSFVAKRDEDD